MDFHFVSARVYDSLSLSLSLSLSPFHTHILYTQLVIMTPKSLLRLPEAKSPFSDMKEGEFGFYMLDSAGI